jgi:hypothetical protein
MDSPALKELVDAIADGRIRPDDAVRTLQRLPFADVGDALVDHHRALRQGVPEAIYGPGKSAQQCVAIVRELLDHGRGPVILTRADEDQARAVLAAHPEALRNGTTIVWRRPEQRRPERVLVCAAGTADATVADECITTLEAYGFDPERLIDVGVAGLHRLLAHVDRVTAADALVVIAGMEGALASVVGGLTAVPVVAVPTSTGYGSGLDGITALLAMLSSCASGVTVVGIDNGFGAACAVARLFARPRGVTPL